MGLTELTIREAARGLRDGTHTATDLVEAAVTRAAQTESELHSYLYIDHEGAREAARRADADLKGGEDRGPLHGIPIALKDNMCTRGVPTTAASQILAGYLPPYDASIVRKLREAGAVIVGKTNLDEFAMGSSTENSAYGPTRNPWDADRVPGGSSGGSAVTVAARSAFGSFGSDTGGSIRQPASLCGVVGMKPTYGLVSRYGLIAFASSLDQIGPFARTVEDAVTLLQTVAGHDPLDATSWNGEYPEFGADLTAGVKGMRVGVLKDLSGEGFEQAVSEAVNRTIGLLSDQGAEIVEISIPVVEVALSAYYLIAPAEASANLARFDGIRYGLRVPGATTEEMMAKTRAEGFGPEVTRRILLGTYALSAGYYDAFYGQAHKLRGLLQQEFNKAYEKVDVLVSPTSPTTAFKIGSKSQDPLAMYLCDVRTIPANLTGQPAVSVPIGLDALGLPVGFQVMAPALGERQMFRVAAEVERLVEFQARPEMLEEWE